MDIATQRYLPVVASILIIILVAVLRDHSRTIAAIVATMPINVPLALWIVYAGANGDKTAMVQFNEALLVNIVPTLCFLVVVWLAARAGWSLVPMIVAGYAAWGVVLGLIHLLRRAAGWPP